MGGMTQAFQPYVDHDVTALARQGTQLTAARALPRTPATHVSPYIHGPLTFGCDIIVLNVHGWSIGDC
jgi:hypothetical protein